MNEAPDKRAQGGSSVVRRRGATDAHSNTTAGLAAVVVVGHASYPSTRDGWLSPGARCRRVNEVDAALLHLEGRTHG